MPELPEVETIKNELLPHVLGRLFIGVAVYDEKPVRRSSAGEFSCRLVGQSIKRLERRGKYLIFHLSSGEVLIMHLRMTGALFLNPGEEDRFDRVAFQFDDGNRMVFSDRRRLGVMWLAQNAKEIWDKLGPEPLGTEFTAKALAQRLKGRQSPIKAVLLDQSIIAGIGNMYADEALFAAKIHPFKKAGDLVFREVQNLYKSILKVLKLAIDNKGASVDTYKRPGGEEGTAHDGFQVAHRRGGTCHVCGATIQRAVVRNRGSYFCPVCQKL
jgi:formamidopyrimidine-DNA glycosylase